MRIVRGQTRGFCRRKFARAQDNSADVLKDQEQHQATSLFAVSYITYTSYRPVAIGYRQTPIGLASCKWRRLFTPKHQCTFDWGLWWDEHLEA